MITKKIYHAAIYLAFRGLMAREKPKKGKGHKSGDATPTG